MSMRVKVWGARGSLPAPHAPKALEERITGLLQDFFEAGYKKKSEISAFLKGIPMHRLGGFGGNTPCLEINTDQKQVIIDGGSGIRQLGYQLMSGPCAQGKG